MTSTAQPLMGNGTGNQPVKERSGFEPAHKIENLAVVTLHGDSIPDAGVEWLGAAWLGAAGGVRLQAEFLDAGVRLDAIEILLVAGAFGTAHQS